MKTKTRSKKGDRHMSAQQDTSHSLVRGLCLAPVGTTLGEAPANNETPRCRPPISIPPAIVSLVSVTSCVCIHSFSLPILPSYISLIPIPKEKPISCILVGGLFQGPSRLHHRDARRRIPARQPQKIHHFLLYNHNTHHHHSIAHHHPPPPITSTTCISDSTDRTPSVLPDPF